MNPLEKEFVPYPEALELKSLDFDEPCYKYIYIGDTGINVDHYLEVEPSKARNYNEDSLCISQPTFSQAFRFFRKKYKLQTYIDFYHSESYFFKIKSQDGRYIGNTGDVILQGSPLFTKPYEEAELACLRKLIEIVKNK